MNYEVGIYISGNVNANGEIYYAWNNGDYEYLKIDQSGAVEGVDGNANLKIIYNNYTGEKTE